MHVFVHLSLTDMPCPLQMNSEQGWHLGTLARTGMGILEDCRLHHFQVRSSRQSMVAFEEGREYEQESPKGQGYA